MDQPNIPKVSVIICVFNNSQYLPEAIESAVKQTYPNLDVWVVNDASTEDICMDYTSCTDAELIPYLTHRADEVEYHSRYDFSHPIQIRRKLYYLKLRKNGGPARARNIAIGNAMAHGSHLFQILDSDDVLFPNKVEELIKPIIVDPERVAITYGDYYIRNEQGLIKYECKPPYSYERFFGGECMIHSGGLINGLALKDFMPTPYPEHQRVTEDFYMYRRVLRSTQWVALNVGMPLTLVRSHSNDSTTSVDKNVWDECYKRTMMET